MSTKAGQHPGPLERLARIADATPADLGRARRALEEAHKAVAPTEALCNLVSAAYLEGRRLGLDLSRWHEIRDGLPGSREHRAARERLEGLHAFHFPVAFPEVFLRKRTGFDVIVGNPPWEKAHVEEHEFWCRYLPGLRSVTQTERERLYHRLRRERPDLVRLFENERQVQDGVRAALMAGPFPGMGAGHPDLYKAFCWRFWSLVCEDGGRIAGCAARTYSSLRQ